MIFASVLSALRLTGSPATDEEASTERPTAEDLHAFERIYDAHAAFVVRSVRRLGIDETAVEDVAQEVFLVAFRRLAEFRGHAAMSTWLFGIALRVVRSHRRTVRRAHLHGAIDLGAAWPETAADPAARQPDAAAETADAYRTLLRLLDQLDDDKREIFVLAELEQLSVPEIAETLGLKLNTAYSRLRLARAAFETALKRVGRPL